MKTPQHVFREYDIRGVAERDLTNDFAFGVGRGLGTIFGERAAQDGTKNGTADGAGEKSRPLRIAVGRDCRLSSPRLHESLVAGLRKAGMHVVDIGVGPTPLLYFAVNHLDADGGVMITGSHNPGDENGFKIMQGKGSFYGPDIQALRTRMEEETYAPSRASPEGAESAEDGAGAEDTEGGYESFDVQPAYVETMTKSFERFPPMTVVVDAGNGAGGPLAVRTMRALGLEPEALYCDMDGRFPHHHPDPTMPENVQALVQRVRATRAQVGIAYDGDADRLGAIDASGEIIWGDKLMILFSRALLAERPGAPILGEVKCSQTLYDDIAKHGGEPIVWKTGHSLIKTKMKESGALLAGEMSGHLFFADRYFGFDDAIYASLRLLEILAKDGRTIGQMLADVPKTFTTPELRVECPDAIKFDVVKAVTERYKKKGLPVLDIDGARISFGKDGEPSWGLVRASNTGPVLVMRFEAASERARDRIRAEVEQVVAEEREALVRSES